MESDTDQQQHEAHEAEVNGAGESESILDGIRQMRAERIAEDVRQLDLDVPGYRHRLAVIYRYPDEGYERLAKAAEREQRERTPSARIEAASDVLVTACAAVVGRNADGKLIDPVSNMVIDEGALPEHRMRFDRSLADRLRIDVPPEVKGVGRYVVRAIFSPRGPATGVYDGDLALITQSNVVFNFLSGAEVAIDEELLGE